MIPLQTAADTLSDIAPTGPSWAGIAGILITLCIFPFLTHFFKKNEKLHEQTQAKVSDHAITLGLHEYRLISLEEWRKYQTMGAASSPAAPPNNVTVNH